MCEEKSEAGRLSEETMMSAEGCVEKARHVIFVPLEQQSRDIISSLDIPLHCSWELDVKLRHVLGPNTLVYVICSLHYDCSRDLMSTA